MRLLTLCTVSDALSFTSIVPPTHTNTHTHTDTLNKKFTLNSVTFHHPPISSEHSENIGMEFSKQLVQWAAAEARSVAVIQHAYRRLPCWHPAERILSRTRCLRATANSCWQERIWSVLKFLTRRTREHSALWVNHTKESLLNTHTLGEFECAEW